MNVTSTVALRLIPCCLELQPVFLCIDDTMVSKFGIQFEDVSNLFDHATHYGSHYLNEHCFVRIMLCIPVWNQQRSPVLPSRLDISYVAEKESEPEPASSMVRQMMQEFSWKKNVSILCDSWYVKKSLVSIVDEYQNLGLNGNARLDSVIYDLAPCKNRKKGPVGKAWTTPVH